MSFKLFSLQLFGKIKPVSVIENRRAVLLRDYEEYCKVENSKELKQFMELKEFVNSGEFKRKKAEIEALNFKGSKEFNQLTELEKLKKAGNIKKYFKAKNSEELKRFDLGKKSEKLSRYDVLFEYVKEGAFEKEKKEIKSQIYKGSVEEKHWKDYKKYEKSAEIKAYKEIHQSDLLKQHEAFAGSEKLKQFLKLKNVPDKDKNSAKEFKKLKRDREIKTYFKVERSKKLKLYRETVDSHSLKRYEELKKYVESEEYKKNELFLKDKRKFEKSEAYKKMQEFKSLDGDPDIRFILKYEKSSLYKNYLDTKNSFDLKRYLELVEIVNSEEFKSRKKYLEDTKKWEKTEDFAKQQKYLEMKSFPHLVNYFKYNGTASFDFLKNWVLTFEDDFSEKDLDNKKWSNTGYIAQNMLGENYSMPGDLHKFSEGGNVKTGGKLVVSVKKEKATGKVWKMPAGFVPAEFDYTSDMVSTGQSFWQEEGVFEVKVKFQPVKQVASSVFLAGKEHSPRLNLIEMGAKNNMGIASLDGRGKLIHNGLDVSNLKKGDWYIITVEKSGGQIKWKLNETEVFSLLDSSLNYPLHLNASSIVVNDIPGSLLPVDFEIAWVRCYNKR